MKTELAINQVFDLDCFEFLERVDDSVVDLAVIDPPYNMKKAEWDTFESDTLFFDFTYSWIDSLIPKLKPNGSLYIFNTPYNSAFILQHLVSRGLFFQNWITWDKRDGMGGARRKFSNGQETILFFTKGQRHTFNYEEIRVPYESTQRIEHAKTKGILKNGKRWFPNPNGRLCGEVWHFSSARHKSKLNGKTQKLGHVTPKPIDLIERIIRASSKPGDLVLDCFVGTGTTAVAARRLDRNFICSDNNKLYVKLANQFLQTEFIGKQMPPSYVSHIVPGNEALEFIDRRLGDDHYRGSWSSQHNRYTMDKVHVILSLLDEYAPNQSRMQIRTSDLSKRPYNLPEEELFARFCGDAKSQVGIGTQDAMRKNLFPDFHRMGLIVRYDKRGLPTDPLRSQPVKYVSLSEQGQRFVNAETIDEQYFIFSSGVDKLLGGFINILLTLLRDPDYKLKRIELHEFMFFVSAIGTRTSFKVNHEQCVDLIHAYRSLTNTQRRSVIETLAFELRPENFYGDKPAQRDFHNWRNKAEQIYYLLHQTVYFEVREKTLYLLKDKVRSFSEKLQYFKNHGVERSPGFELHHVVPLSWSESQQQFKLFDNWKNMVYISAFDHATITQNRNRNVLMKAANGDIVLSDYSSNSVHLKDGKNLLYSVDKQPIIVDYNRRLRESVD